MNCKLYARPDLIGAVAPREDWLYVDDDGKDRDPVAEGDVVEVRLGADGRTFERVPESDE